MLNIVKTLFNICLLKDGPEDLPCSIVLLGFFLLASLVVSILIGSIVQDMYVASVSSIASLFFTFIFTKILLLKKPERFLQTFSAMLGSVVIINIFSIPSIYSLTYLELGEMTKLFFGMTIFALFIWIIIVYGYIFSKALSALMGYGLAISVAYALLNLMILEFFIVGNTTT